MYARACDGVEFVTALDEYLTVSDDLVGCRPLVVGRLLDILRTTFLDVIEGRVVNPEEMFIGQEDMAHIQEKLSSSLSDLERKVLDAFLQGKSYQEIAEILGRHPKSIDNALQRVKKKLIAYINRKQNDE